MQILAQWNSCSEDTEDEKHIHTHLKLKDFYYENMTFVCIQNAKANFGE